MLFVLAVLVGQQVSGVHSLWATLGVVYFNLPHTEHTINHYDILNDVLFSATHRHSHSKVYSCISADNAPDNYVTLHLL